MVCALRYNPKPMGLGYAVEHTAPRTLPLSADRFNRTIPRMLLLLTLLVAWALRLVAVDRQDIWWDEARNIDVALRPFTQVAVAPELDIHPPLYFWLLHGWARLNALHLGMEPSHMAMVTRLLSVMAGVLGVALLYQLARRCSPEKNSRWAGLVAATLGALSPFWLAESQETRMYTVGFALLLGASVALLEAWRRVQNSPLKPTAEVRVPLLCFVLLSAFALLTHYNAVFIVCAWYLGWLLWAITHPQRRRFLMTMLVCGVATALLVAPIAPIALRQIPGYANPNLGIPSLWSYLAQNWQAYWGGYAFEAALGHGWAVKWLWLAAALAVIGMVSGWQSLQNKMPFVFLLLWLFGGLALYYIAVLDRGAFNVRYSSFVTPALYALIGLALTAWGRLWRPLAFLVLVVALAIWPQAIYADLYDQRFSREDISGVTTWLREHAGPGAVIFVDQKYPFGFYYPRYTIDPAASPNGDEAAPARYLFVDINTIDKQLQEWAGEATQVYWVQWFESDTDPRRAVTFLLDQAGERAGEEIFQGYSIDWWQLTPPNTFALAPNMTPLTFAFPPAVQTVEVSLPDEPVVRGGHLPVVIRWQRQAGGEVTRPLKARVALYNADGGRISQRDERLLNDRHLLPAEWSPQDRPLNVYLLDVPDDLVRGQYTIGLLVYDADTLEPLGVVDEAGNATGVEATIGTVEVVESEP